MEDKNQIDKIRCPNCDELIPITETLQHQLTEKLHKEYEGKLAKNRESILLEKKKLEEDRKNLEDKKRDINEQVKQAVKSKLESQEKALTKKVEKQVKEEMSIEIEDLKSNLKIKEEKLEKAKNIELDLRKRERELKERERDMELEVEREMEVERKKIEDEVSKRMLDEYQMKYAEQEKKMGDMKKQINDLKRKSEQGSQQFQGEIQELELEKKLTQLFPEDNINPVPKGARGADVIQEVKSKKGNFCGAIIWESKRTKNWKDEWIKKLKDDQRSAKSDVAIIVTQVLPKNIRNFGLIDGVLISDYVSFHGLAVVIRQSLIKEFVIKSMTNHKDRNTEILFNYITGSEFKQRVETIIEIFSDMENEIAKEKRTYAKLWAKREKQIQSVIANTSGIYGDLQGILGSSMQDILALESGDEIKEG